MRVFFIAFWEREDNQVGRLAGSQTARLVGPAKGLGAGERRHPQQRRAGKVRILTAEEARLGEEVEVGVGGKAVGAQGDAVVAAQELAEGVRRMAEGRVRAGAV